MSPETPVLSEDMLSHAHGTMFLWYPMSKCELHTDLALIELQREQWSSYKGKLLFWDQEQHFIITADNQKNLCSHSNIEVGMKLVPLWWDLTDGLCPLIWNNVGERAMLKESWNFTILSDLFKFIRTSGVSAGLPGALRWLTAAL